MRKVAVTVEALRCHECQGLIDPVDGHYVRRQMKTAVEVGHRYGTVSRYEMVNVCLFCHQRLEALEAAEQQRKWWFRFWSIIGVVVFVTGWLSYLPLAALVCWRVRWKRQAKQRQQQSAPGPADRRQVPQAAATSDAARDCRETAPPDETTVSRGSGTM